MLRLFPDGTSRDEVGVCSRSAADRVGVLTLVISHDVTGDHRFTEIEEFAGELVGKGHRKAHCIHGIHDADHGGDDVDSSTDRSPRAERRWTACRFTERNPRER